MALLTDFNNLLTAIVGYSQLLLGRLEVGNPMQEQLEEIKMAGERAASLTRQLLAFSRKELMQPQVLDLNTLVGNIDKMLRRLIGEHIELVTMFGPGLERIEADPAQLEQVVLNLVVNARDAMPQGGKIFKPACDALGVKGVTHQSLRRTCSTYMLDIPQANLKDVQAHLRHSSAETTLQIYVQEIPESVRHTVEEMADRMFRSTWN